jgi:ABC-type taurine transport system ATPase subunit
MWTGPGQTKNKEIETMLDRYDNVKVELDGTKMTLTIETDEAKVNTAPSKSGKTQVIATTGGALTISNGNGERIKLNLTLYRPL